MPGVGDTGGTGRDDARRQEVPAQHAMSGPRHDRPASPRGCIAGRPAEPAARDRGRRRDAPVIRPPLARAVPRPKPTETAQATGIGRALTASASSTVDLQCKRQDTPDQASAINICSQPELTQ